jgi:2'-5' RNA ligase
MDGIEVPVAPPLSRLHRVELMHAGTWNLSTGPATFSADDFAAAVAALECPAVRRPILKLGHTDPRFNDPETGMPYDGQPAVGWIDNMATFMDGQGLIGDYVGMPGWLGPILPSAYPDRSIEGGWNYVCQIGHLHPFVLTAVALLGVSAPGIGTLESLQDVGALYGVAAAEASSPAEVQFELLIRAVAGQTPTGAMVALIPSDVDAKRLAVPDGESAAELHVTLRYLGNAADIDAEVQQAVIDAVTAIAEQTAPIEGDGFSVALFNPTNADRPTCVVLGINGADLATAHDQVGQAVDALDIDMPDANLPWTAHLTLEYTDDANQVQALANRTGPIVFDRLRVAFAGVATDIPLGGTPVAATRKDSTMPNPSPRQVAAGVSVDDVRMKYYDTAPYSFWICEIELNPLQLIVSDDSTDNTYRVEVTVDGDTITFAPPVQVAVTYVDMPATAAATADSGAKRFVFASRAESRPDPKASDSPVTSTSEAPVTTAEQGVDPVADAAPTPAPAAEPVPTTTEEDTLSTITSDVRSRLGLADDADDAAILAALDEKLTTPTVPAPDPVAAAASAEMATEVRRLSGELATIKAREADQIRTSLFDAAVRAGKVAPAEVDAWKARYDKAPEVIAEVLASIAPGTAVPVQASGYASTEEPAAAGDQLSADEARLFPTPAKV